MKVLLSSSILKFNTRRTLLECCLECLDVVAEASDCGTTDIELFFPWTMKEQYAELSEVMKLLDLNVTFLDSPELAKYHMMSYFITCDAASNTLLVSATNNMWSDTDTLH